MKKNRIIRNCAAISFILALTPAGFAKQFTFYTAEQAVSHLGEHAVVMGKLLSANTNSNGTVTLHISSNADGNNYFLVVIPPDRVAAVGSLAEYVGAEVRVRGMIITGPSGRPRIRMVERKQLWVPIKVATVRK